jgi:hypothetical protein
LPVVIRTRAISGWSNTIPKNERLPSPGDAGTNPLKSSRPLAAKYSMTVLARRFPLDLSSPSCLSTSVKTAPNALTFAGVAPLVPGIKNVPSVMLLPTGVNNRSGLKTVKMLSPYVGLLKRPTRPPWGPPAGRRLRKTRSQSGEPCTTCVQEDVERCDRRSGSIDVTAAIPVDFAATDRRIDARGITIVGFTELSAKRIHHALNRCSIWSNCLIWSGGLKDERRKSLTSAPTKIFGLRSGLAYRDQGHDQRKANPRPRC